MIPELPRLKYRISYEVDCFELDKFAAIHLAPYGLEWKALDTGYDGYHNGSFFSTDVEVGLDIEDDLDQDFNRWLEGGYFYAPEGEDFKFWDKNPGIQHMLQWLCNKAQIPEGRYVVELWW